MSLFKPMLAGTIEDMSKLKYPLYASIKYDGIRVTMQGGKLLSRTLKPIPNKNVQDKFKHLPKGFDGELMFGNPAAKDVFRQTTSIVMSHDKPADKIAFYGFDRYEMLPFHLRYKNLLQYGSQIDVEYVQQVIIANETELLAYEQKVLDNGFEGLILRSVDGPYKEGRSSEKQGYLLKLKRFIDAEAMIISAYEEVENQNEATTNLLGRTERSSHKVGMVGKQTLGGFDVIGINGEFNGTGFSVASGLTALERDKLWKIRTKLPKQIIKYKYFPIGCKDKPRLPIFLGFRDKRDM